MVRSGPVIEAIRPRRFDVLCAGQPVWRPMASPGDVARVAGPALLNVTKLLAPVGLRVGLVTMLDDDRRGRSSLAELTALGVEVGAVKLASVATDLVIVDAAGGWSGVVPERARPTNLEVPPSWSSHVLLLSGLVPATSNLAAFCKAARKARRDGTVVVLDLVGSLRDWAGRDARLVSMVLREADVVRCSFVDLAVIGTDAGAVRRTMRPNATLVVDDRGGATAVGTFGEVTVEAPRTSSDAEGFADGCTAAICVELARPGRVGETPGGRWHRVLRHDAPRLAATHPRG
jgi:sugar/nucleoside kinase (ribokinase family)